jgi:hypothetical protein
MQRKKINKKGAVSAFTPVKFLSQKNTDDRAHALKRTWAQSTGQSGSE